jgi:hypothetical protein
LRSIHLLCIDLDQDCFVKLSAELRKKRKQLMQLRSLLDNATNNNSDGNDIFTCSIELAFSYENAEISLC